MKRNVFGNPRPMNADEMIEALEEGGFDPSAVQAEISQPDELDRGTEFHGWSAEVRDDESGEEVFTAAGYESKEQLLIDLANAGICDISFLSLAE